MNKKYMELEKLKDDINKIYDISYRYDKLDIISEIVTLYIRDYLEKNTSITIDVLNNISDSNIDLIYFIILLRMLSEDFTDYELTVNGDTMTAVVKKEDIVIEKIEMKI